jgi:tetratricopeptide (TPR) repeat protein
MAYHNLAVILKRKGQLEAAVEHLERALEIDPQYVYARCTLARYYLFDWEDVETAKAILTPIQEKSPLTPDDFLYYQRTLADVAIEEEDYELARRHAETMLELDPQNEIAHELLEYLDEVEEYKNSFWAERFARRRRLAKRKLERSVRPDATLAESLDRLTKNALVGTARAMPVPRTYNVRKAELIEDLAQFLMTPLWLKRIVEDLSEEERQALRDVLNAGGTFPWEEFTARYGHDLDESPDWNYHEPETVMGRLRMLGLLSRGRLGEEYILLVPNELRPLLPPLLGMERA